MVSVVNDIKTAISQNVKLRPGTSVSFSGQFELLEHANKKLKLMVPMTDDHFHSALSGVPSRG
jgi:Cu(I)/Ag(I) efflux system membrane protein CusA/SilA